MSIEITDLDYRHATDGEYVALHRCRNRIRAEQLPDDPPLLLDEIVQSLRTFPQFMEMRFWIAWDAPKENMVGYSQVQLPKEDNLHLAQFGISVLPEYRQQGIGKRLLSRVVAVAQAESRRLLITSTMDRIPAGEAFMNRIGADRGLETHTNQLIITDLDRDLLHQWQTRAQDRASGFEIGMWQGEYPEGDMDAIVRLHDLLNQQPFGALEVEDTTYTADHLRQIEKSLFSRGYERWTLFARETESTKFAGYTEVLWSPNRPEIVSQGMTGVFPEFRNLGLGRWLKAEMLIRILSQRPEAKYVRTDNADMNEPMLKINRELGFKPYISESIWQVETAQVASYLAR